MATVGRFTKRRRLLLAAGTAGIVAAVAVLATGVSLAFFSARGTAQSGTLSAGTVTLSTSATNTCNVGHLLPGQSPAACRLQATYGGSVPAWMALDVLIATKAGAPGNTPLYNPLDSANDLQITVTDSQSSPVTYVSPSTSFGSAIACPSGSGFGSAYTCYQLSDLLVSTTPFTASTPSDTFTTSVTLPMSNGSGYQGGAASIVLTVHAAQAGNNPDAGCTAAGSQCTSVHWS